MDPVLASMVSITGAGGEMGLLGNGASVLGPFAMLVNQEWRPTSACLFSPILFEILRASTASSCCA